MSDSGFERRTAYYERLVAMADTLGAKAVSIWSGAADPVAEPTLARLADRLRPVLECAAAHGVTVALEPEPGMFVERVAEYDALVAMLPAELRLALTIDVGHLVVSESPPYERHIVSHAGRLAVVHLDDANPGVHEHRMIGDGVVDWTALAAALHSIAFEGPLVVELSRHSHDAVRTARSSIERLRAFGF
jgi:sugar phosphate isomerase/epimerase